MSIGNNVKADFGDDEEEAVHKLENESDEESIEEEDFATIPVELVRGDGQSDDKS
jgi:hypothetical protein